MKFGWVTASPPRTTPTTHTTHTTHTSGSLHRTAVSCSAMWNMKEESLVINMPGRCLPVAAWSAGIAPVA